LAFHSGTRHEANSHAAAGAKTSHRSTGEKPDAENLFSASDDDGRMEDDEGKDINDDDNSNGDASDEDIGNDDGGGVTSGTAEWSRRQRRQR
jgi:hypothetical protein